MPAVKMPVKLHDHRPTRIGSSDAMSKLGCFRAGGCEAHSLSARDKLAHELSPTDFELVAGAEMRAQSCLAGHRFHHRRKTVTHEQSAVAHPVVNQRPAAH